MTILGTFGFEVVSVRGSHAKLRRTADGQRQTLHVPLHSELDTGTAQAIFRQAAGYISAADLRPHFYSD
ncbi:MAG TPA: type II toxin-antitoxin system HicA family toxin [Tepidiformaceae bacterium]|nr:type II toxin-antitoxin system HicA family toxin [Tepidiformaceae bacterium]